MSLVETIALQPTIATALKSASVRTGTDFDYLLKTAMRESSLDYEAKSTTSSALGLFQFTEQSWLGTLKKHGAELGLGSYAEAISQTGQGRYTVANAAQRAEILALREDPHTSALMAGAYTQDSAGILENRIGRSASEGELYIAHFLGAGGAAKLIEASEETPNARADMLFPAAAAANRSIFYAKDGTPRSAAEVHANLVAKHEGADATRIAELAGNARLSSERHRNVTNGSGVLTDLAGGDNRRGYATRGATLLSPASGGRSGVPAGTSYGRTPLKLTPGVVELLSSLDPIPEGRETQKSGDKVDRREAAEERRERLKPHSGFSFG
ncbi:MAG: lytic transglycosylase domain-containing protein [Parvibaculum sp.]|uniref:lytic transglycosylase domain-containing protein n=1 Tax=Parvibaculum sp. TaxID=2024848 RepID=UPI002AB89DE7|nr:lytic transglycosylase domain-containing protein [Parvibaculum sp.]MDZ4380369.1 lytic transglycosylase domain-containing protein [Parvibaculum sp.]